VVAAVVVGGSKHGTARHQGVGPGGHDFGDVVHLHATVHFEPDGLATVGHVGVDALTGVHQFRQGTGDELLPAEARVHAHEQHHVEFVHHMVHQRQRRGRVEHQAGLAAVVTD